VEEVANAFVTFMFDDIGGHIVGRMEERIGEGKVTAFSAAATEVLNEYAGFFREPEGVRGCVWGSRLLRG
jgi:hypothetical protein